MSEEKIITKEQLYELSDDELSNISGGFINSVFDEANWLGFTNGSWAVGHKADIAGGFVESSWPGIVVGMGCKTNFMAGTFGPYTITIERTFPNGERGTKTFDVRNCTKE